ncbi:MAG TPA: hypothetical protein VNX70_13105 [Bryobacteraceae bacterium]|jgi:hypothetical protein|nr:hypothetical protein [Bryobacteraceae bacterium]
MKKLMSILLGLSLFVGAATVFAQDTDKSKTTTKKKKKKKTDDKTTPPAK